MGPDDLAAVDNSPAARTERLYWFLRNMGLCVSPIFNGETLTALQVACADSSTESSIVSPMEGAQVGEAVGTAKGSGFNVVDFPSVV